MKRLASIALSLLVVSSSLSWADDDETKEVKKEIEVKVIVEDGEVRIDGLGGDTRVLKLSDLKDGTWVSESPEGLKATAIFVADDGEVDVLSEGHKGVNWTSDEGKQLKLRVMLGDREPGDQEHGGGKVIKLDGDRFMVKGRGDVTIDDDSNVWISKLGDRGEQHANVWVSKMGSAGDYMIGLMCTPAGDTLRSQLKIDAGLVVMEVVDDSPADEAGLQQHDVIVAVNGEELEDVDGLVKAVQGAGENGEPLSIKLLREGDWQKVSVTPAKRESAETKVRVRKMRAGDDDSATVEEFKDKSGNKVVIVKKLGDEDGEVSAKVERIIESIGDGEPIDLDAIKELAKEHGGKVMIRREKKSASQKDTQELRQEIEELKKMIAELKEALDDE